MKRSASDVNRLLLDPPRMSFAPDVRALRKDVPRIDKITFLVNTGDGTMRPESETTVHAALQALSDQFLFLCPDQMRVGAPAEFHFKTKEGLTIFSELNCWSWACRRLRPAPRVFWCMRS